MSTSHVRARCEVRLERTVREVRDTAAEILAVVGAVKLRRIALFRATKWAEISAEAYLDARDHADVQWMRAAGWLRIGWAIPSSAAPHWQQTSWSSTMSNTTDQSIVDQTVESEPFADPAEFTALIAEMVADQAPRVFAVVVEFGERLDAQIVAWGLALADGAYVTTVDGRNQYSLAEPENALKYVRNLTGTTPHLVWVGSSSELGSGQDQSESFVQRDEASPLA